jgi:hypothetical protein
MKMKLHTLIGILAAIVLVACDKDSFTSRPQLKLKSVSTDFVPLNAPLQFTFEFTDKEGDLGDAVGIQKISSTCDDASFIDTLKFTFPDIPRMKNTEGTLEVNLTNINLLPIRCFGGDTVETAIFRFWIKDLAGNVSDTVEAGPITIMK